MAKRQKKSIGVDLGGTKILTCAIDEKDRVVGRYKTSTPAKDGADAVVLAIDSAVRSLCESIHWDFDAIEAVGVAVPAPVDPKVGIVEKATNLGWIDFPAKKALEKLLKKRIHLENDVNAGTYGESVFGAGRGFGDIVGIFLGTGIGGGIVLNGKLHRGKNRAAGEVGHMVIQEGGYRQGLGFPGTFESVASRMAIQKYLVGKMQEGKKSLLLKKHKKQLDDPHLRIKSGDLRKAAEAGDKLVLKALHRNAHSIGIHCAGLIHFLGPEIIILGGGVMEALEPFLLQTIINTVEEYTFEITRRGVEITVAKLGDDAVPLGAAALAREKRKN